MKSFQKYSLCLVCILFFTGIKSQTINWHTLQPGTKNILTAGVSVDHSFSYVFSYGYQVSSNRPVVLTAEYSFPSGENITDDFKTRIGGKVRWLKKNNFYLASTFNGIFRRYQSEFVRQLNFGSEISVQAGYYKSKWFVAAELGFDKAIITHFRHSDIYKQNFPGVKDGWFEPSSGGNLFAGLQGGISGKKTDLFLKLGKLKAQDFVTDPLIPVYAGLGFNFRF